MTRDTIDNEKEFQLLFQTLKRARGFRLYLVQCNDSRLQSDILASLKNELDAEGITVYQHHLSNQVISFDDFFPPGFPKDKKRREKSVLMVSGLENSLAPVGMRQEFLYRLNFSRDLLPKKIPMPLVLWLPPGVFDLLLTESHDLWSWRSGTFYFSNPQKTAQHRYNEHTTIRGRETQSTGISEKRYREELRYLNNFLEDLTLDPDNQTTRLRIADVLEEIGKLHALYAVEQVDTEYARQYINQAMEMQTKALKIKESLLNALNPEIAGAYYNMSNLYLELNQPKMALEFQEKAVKIRETVLDRGHPDLEASYHALSLIYNSLGQFEKASKFQNKSANTKKK